MKIKKTLLSWYTADFEKAGCFAVIVLQMNHYYKCSKALPQGALGWSAVCDYGIF